MSNTAKHAALAFAWLTLLPLFMMLGGSQNSALNSFLWVGGLAFSFTSWALQDAKNFDVKKSTVYWHTAGWLIIPILIVFSYLYVSRGKKGGTIASLKYLTYCVICWVGFGLLVRLSNYV